MHFSVSVTCAQATLLFIHDTFYYKKPSVFLHLLLALSLTHSRLLVNEIEGVTRISSCLWHGLGWHEEVECGKSIVLIFILNEKGTKISLTLWSIIRVSI